MAPGMGTAGAVVNPSWIRTSLEVKSGWMGVALTVK